jgi:phosphoribosylformylglycinamidine synthase
MRKTKFAIIVFPGSNCDHDAHYAITDVLGQEAELVWHKDTELHGADVIVLPGGFSYGDYLRSGAIAQFSPVMGRVAEFASAGGPVLGICNGFQVLLEAGLLPGAMRRNQQLEFICEQVDLRVEQIDTPFTQNALAGQVLKIPIAHGEGNYYAPPEIIAELEAKRRVIFRYTSPEGVVDEACNVNGSTSAIAGICNEARNVVGLMPHPERACEQVVGSADGRVILESVITALDGVVKAGWR